MSFQATLPSRPEKTRFLRTAFPLSIQANTARIGCLLLVPVTLTLIFLSAGLGFFFFSWLTIAKGVDLQHALSSGAFLVDEGHNATWSGMSTSLFGLSISTVTTHVVSATAPFLVGLVAYCTAAIWLNAQATNNGALPTPLQYGLLFKLLSAPGLKGIYDCSRYFLRSKRKRPASPTALVLGFVFSVGIYLIIHLIIVCDLWLHSTTFATIGNFTTSVPILGQPLLGFTFDEDLCGLVNNTKCIFPVNSDVAEVKDALARGENITSNAADTGLSVMILEDYDGLAVVVPNSTNISESATWTAPSFGVRAKCQNITPQMNRAFDDPVDWDNITVTFPNVSADSGPMVVHIGDSDQMLGHWGLTMAAVSSPDKTQLVQDLNATGTPQVHFASDPPTMVILFAWQSLIPLYLPDGAFYQNNSNFLWASTQCQMDFFNLTIRGDTTRSTGPSQQISTEYSLDGAPVRNGDSFAATMWSPLLTQQVNRYVVLSFMSQGLLKINQTTLMASVSQTLTVTTLSLFAGTLKPAPVNNIFTVQPIILGQYPVIPVLTYVALLVIYSFIALGIFFWSSLIKSRVISMPGVKGKKISALELAQVQLSDPLVVIAQAFEREVKPEDNLKKVNQTEGIGVSEGEPLGMCVNEGGQGESGRQQGEILPLGNVLTSNYLRTAPTISTNGLDLFPEDTDTKKLVLSIGKRGLRLRVREHIHGSK